MQIKFYQILIFVCVIVSATVIVFPSKTYIVKELIKSGQLETARMYIQRFTENDPDNALLFTMSADTYLLEGRPDQAIGELNKFVLLYNESKDVWMRLVQLYEWEREPQKALAVLEQASVIFSYDPDIWYRLISYYRYLGLMDKEIDAIVALANLNYKIVDNDTILSIIDQKLFEVAGMHTKQPMPITTYILSKLQIARSNYFSDINDPDISPKDKKEAEDYAVTRIIELYVYADLHHNIKTFAKNIDIKQGTGFKYRITLMNVMRWADIDDEAVAYLWELHDQYPHQMEILENIAQISRENGNYEPAIAALEKMLKLHPEHPEYNQLLGRLYIESEQYASAFDLYKKMIQKYPDQNYGVQLLKVSSNSGNVDLMRDAVDFIEQLNPKTPDLLKQLVDLYINIEMPQKAFETSLTFIQSQPVDREFMEKILQSAMWADNQAYMKQAIAIIDKNFPDDLEFTQKSVDAYIALNMPKDAFLLAGKIIHQMTDDRAFFLKYMDAASYTQIPEMMTSAALTTARLRPKDFKIIQKSVQLLQWTNHMAQAYDIYENWFLNYGGSSAQAQLLLKLAQESGVPENVKEALQVAKNHMPSDPKTQLRYAKQAMDNGLTDEAILSYEAYLSKKPKDIRIKRKLAELYVQAGQNDMAFDMYRQLYVALPDDPNIQDRLVEIAGWTQNTEALAYVLANQANQAASDLDLQIKAGEAFIASGETEKSIPFFERALALQPENIDLHRKLAQYYGWLSRYDEIIRVLESLQQLTPLSGQERVVLAQAAMDRNQPQKVVSLLSPLQKDKLLTQTSGMLLALAYERTGQKQSAVNLYRQLSRKFQDNAKFLSNMGNQLLWMDQLEVALSLYQLAMKTEPENLVALKGSAQIYAWQNNTEKAIEYFKQYVKLQPNDYEVQYQLGELLFYKGQQRYAFKHYQKALTLIDKKQKQMTQ